MAVVAHSFLARGGGPPAPRPFVVGESGQPDLSRQWPAGQPIDPWAVLGVPARLDLDVRAVELQMRGLIRALHPDRFYPAGNDAVLAAQRHTSLVNDAWRTLRDLERRVTFWLAQTGDAPGEAFKLPAALALQVFDRNEALDEWLASAARHAAQVVALRDEVLAERQALAARVRALAVEADDALDADADVAAIRAELRAVIGHASYLDNLLARISGQA